MFAWSELSIYITRKVVIISVIITAILSLYLYISYLRNTIVRLEQDKATLQIAVETQQRTIEGLQEDFKKVIAAKDAIVNKTKELEKKNDELRETLFRETLGKTSIEDLALLDKKGRIQKLINEATKKVLRCFEILTGSPLKENEKNACN
jgi:predicted RNase H-like nuclease (RuvC/YqgF family)